MAREEEGSFEILRRHEEMVVSWGMQWDADVLLMKRRLSCWRQGEKSIQARVRSIEDWGRDGKGEEKS